MVLKTCVLSKPFGGLTAVSQFDMYVNEGEIVGLIGPNSAGKTTLFNLVTGFLRPSQGKVIFDEEDITGKKPHLIARRRTARTFQLNPLFADYTTLENVLASFYLHPRSNLWDAFLNTSTCRHNEKQKLVQSLNILQLMGLYKFKDELAKN